MVGGEPRSVWSLDDADGPTDPIDDSTNLTFATFDPSGDRIYAGTRDGTLRVYDARSRWIIWKQQVATSLIKQIAFDRTGRYMVINSSDRAVRVLAITPRTREADRSQEQEDDLFPITIHPLHRFQDKIGKTPWNTVAFSGDGEYVMGGAGIKTSHHIYVWDRSTGVLIKVLEGPKDALDDCDVSHVRWTCMGTDTEKTHPRVTVEPLSTDDRFVYFGRRDQYLADNHERGMERFRTRFRRTRGESRIRREGGRVRSGER